MVRPLVRVGLLVSSICGVAVLAACVPQPQGVPTWAMHVRPSMVDFNYGANQATSRLMYEFSQQPLVDGHLSPEQIAWLALAEIQQGHHRDAALFLAIASYRYQEEAWHAYDTGRASAKHLPNYVRADAYADLVMAEVNHLHEFDFDDAVEALTVRSHGSPEKEVALQEQLTSLGRTSAIERESVREALRALGGNTGGEAGTTAYPQLAEAFRRHMVDELRREPKNPVPAFYLALTPIAQLQATALNEVQGWFEPLTCRSVAYAFPLHRPAALANLTAKRPQVRANAAATLALAPAEESSKALQAQLAVETDPQVKLALAYALTHHGVPGHVAALNAAVRTCVEPACSMAAGLINWLPRTALAEVERPALVALVSGAKIDRRARMFAIATLRDHGHETPLDQAAVDALIVASRIKSKRDRLAELATSAVAEASIFARPLVIARLDITSPTVNRQDSLFPVALLARLAQVSIAEDLSLLAQLMNRFGDGEGAEGHYIVDAALHVEGADADARLINWFRRYEKLRTHIAVGLAGRPSVSRPVLDRLVAAADARTFLAVKIIRKDPDLRQAWAGYLRSDDIGELFAAAEFAPLAKPAETDGLRPLLNYHSSRYYPNDAIVRFTAMNAFVRLALDATRPARPAAPDAASSAASSAASGTGAALTPAH